MVYIEEVTNVQFDYFSDGKCKTDVKNAISGYKVTGTKMLPKGDSAMLSAVSDPSIGVLSVAIGVVNSFHSFKVRLRKRNI